MKNKLNKENISIGQKKFILSYKRKKAIILAAQIGILVFGLIIWEVLTRFKLVDAFFISSPTRIAKAMGLLFKSGEIYEHMGITLLECILGFTISTVVGVLIAIGLWWSDYLRRIFDPYLVIFNSLPKIALAPIIIIWVGLGMKAIVAMAFLICIIITITSVLNGFISCDPDKILLMRTMGATKAQIMLKLVLPYSVPNLIAVLKMNIGLSWVGTIMGEYLTSKAGLGYLIIYGGQVFKIDLVMAATTLLCFMAGIMYIGVSLIEKKVSKSR